MVLIAVAKMAVMKVVSMEARSVGKMAALRAACWVHWRAESWAQTQAVYSVARRVACLACWKAAWWAVDLAVY